MGIHVLNMKNHILGHNEVLIGSTTEERNDRLDRMWEIHLALAAQGNVSAARTALAVGGQ